jgi:CheY-like chemotaxis protein
MGIAFAHGTIKLAPGSQMPAVSPFSPSRVWSTRIFEPVGAPISALLIDDDERIAQALAAVLEVEGFDVRIADCVHCFKIVEQWAPSVVLLDMEMPVMNGFRVAKELRRLNHCVRTPIIAYTSLAEDDVRLQGIPAGIDAYCRKGDAPHALIALIKAIAPSG